VVVLLRLEQDILLTILLRPTTAILVMQDILLMGVEDTIATVHLREVLHQTIGAMSSIHRLHSKDLLLVGHLLLREGAHLQQLTIRQGLRMITEWDHRLLNMATPRIHLHSNIGTILLTLLKRLQEDPTWQKPSSTTSHLRLPTVLMQLQEDRENWIFEDLHHQ